MNDINIHQLILAKLYENDFATFEATSNYCLDVINNWDMEFHNTKEITEFILKNLGTQWENKIDALFSSQDESPEISILRNFNMYPPLPLSGKTRVRILKYVINEILLTMYNQIKEFKYYIKYNPSPSAYYRVFKDSSYKVRNKLT